MQMCRTSASPPPAPQARVARQAAASTRVGINNSACDRLRPPRCGNILFPGCIEEEEEEEMLRLFLTNPSDSSSLAQTVRIEDEGRNMKAVVTVIYQQTGTFPVLLQLFVFFFELRNVDVKQMRKICSSSGPVPNDLCS